MIPTHQNQISEQDLEMIFSDKKPKKRNKFLSVIKYTLLFIIITICIFTAINYQALKLQLSYWYHHDYKNDTVTQNSNYSSKVVSSNLPNLPDVADNHILIPSISTDAPISWLVPNTPAETSKALENGAIHLLGTATPGTVGNVFVTGHSSNYLWAPGNYKSLFALLDKTSVGEMIYINYQQKTYSYKIFEKKVVNPNDVSVLNQSQKSILTLMTCTPVGTSLNRLIVLANQTYPAVDSNVKNSTSQSAGALPNVR